MSNYKEFFDRHVKNIRNGNLRCEECGDKLRGDYSEVCHILPKGYFKSIAEDDSNIIYLCSWKNKNNCHSILDDSKSEQMQQMKIFDKCQKVVEQLLERVSEKIHYKVYDRWKI